jgi:uncharacterized protein
MKKILIFTFTLIPYISFSQTDSTKVKDIKRLLIVSGSANSAKVGIEGMINSMKGSSNQNGLPDGFWDEFLKEVNYDELSEIYIPLYDKSYTHQEIIDMINFYESPTGKKMLEKMPSILLESMNLGREWGQKLGAKVYEKMKKK